MRREQVSGRIDIGGRPDQGADADRRERHTQEPRWERMQQQGQGTAKLALNNAQAPVLYSGSLATPDRNRP